MSKQNYPIFVLREEMRKIKKRLDSDVIVDMRFQEEIQEDKDKIRQLKRSIAVLENGYRVLKPVSDWIEL